MDYKVILIIIILYFDEIQAICVRNNGRFVPPCSDVTTQAECEAINACNWQVAAPSTSPTAGGFATATKRPTAKTKSPTSTSPSFSPTFHPTSRPSNSPVTTIPTNSPTTSSPTFFPSNTPTIPPTFTPTTSPFPGSTEPPSSNPTQLPSLAPISQEPTSTPVFQKPTKGPTSSKPSKSPSIPPTASPTKLPTLRPTSTAPTKKGKVTATPSSVPSKSPTVFGFVQPSSSPTFSIPTISPSARRRKTSQPTSPTTVSPTNSPKVKGKQTKSPTTLHIGAPNFTDVTIDRLNRIRLSFNAPIAIISQVRNLAVDDASVKDQVQTVRSVKCSAIFLPPLDDSIVCKVSNDGFFVISSPLKQLFQESVTLLPGTIASKNQEFIVDSVTLQSRLELTLYPSPNVRLQLTPCDNVVFTWAKLNGKSDVIRILDANWTVSNVVGDVQSRVQSLFSNSLDVNLQRSLIQSKDFLPNSAFTLQLFVTNELGLEGFSDLLTVTLNNNAALEVTGASFRKNPFPQQEMVFPQSANFVLRVPTYGDNCTELTNASITWQYLSGPFPTDFFPIIDSFVMNIYPRTLPTGNYTIRANLGAIGRQTFNFEITPDTSPRITGGDRVITLSDENRIELSLLNLPFKAKEDYTWESIPGGQTTQAKFLGNTRGSKVRIDLRSLSFNETYYFTVISPSFTVTPVFLHLIDSDDASIIIQGLNSGRVNVDSSLVLTAVPSESFRKKVFVWTQLEGDFTDLSDFSARKQSIYFPSNTLSPDTSYTFSVSSGDVSAIVSFTTNSPPLEGYVIVEPLIGFATITDFRMQAIGFFDDDLPISYSFLFNKKNCPNPRRQGFTPITTFSTDDSAISKLEFGQNASIGVIVRDALNATTSLVAFNSCITVLNLNTNQIQQAFAKAGNDYEEGIQSIQQSLSTLSLASNGDTKVSQKDLIRIIQSARKAADYAPKGMISSLAIENRVAVTLATDYSEYLKNSSDLMQQTVNSLGSVLDRTQVVLKSSESDTEGDYVHFLVQDSLDSSSSILEAVSNDNSIRKSSISVPDELVDKVIQVQLLSSTAPSPNSNDGSSQTSPGPVLFSSKNIDTTFALLAKQKSFLLSPTNTEEAAVNLFQVTLTDDDYLATSGLFVASSLYRINPYAKFYLAENQSLISQVTSLQVFDDLSHVQYKRSTSSFSIQRTAINIDKNKTIFCGAFDGQQWSDRGCSFKGMTDKQIFCECVHTTDYTAWVLTGEQIVQTFTNITYFGDFNNGWAVTTLLIIWAVCTILMYFVGMYLDARDMKRRVKGILLALKLKRLRNIQVRNRVFQAWRVETMKLNGAIVDPSIAMTPSLASLVSLGRRNRQLVGSSRAQELPPLRIRLWRWFSVALFREHTILNTIYLLDVFLSRPVRVLCGAAIVLGEMFASAMFFNFSVDETVTTGTQILIGILSTILVAPVLWLFVLLTRRVSPVPDNERKYLQQMMVVFLAEMGERVENEEDVQAWAKFAQSMTWDELATVHHFHVLKDKLRQAKKKRDDPQLMNSLELECSYQRTLIWEAWRKQKVSATPAANVSMTTNSSARPLSPYAVNLPVTKKTKMWMEQGGVVANEEEEEKKTDEEDDPTMNKVEISMNQNKAKRRFSQISLPDKKVVTKPILWMLRSKTNPVKSFLPPPQTNNHLSHKWMIVSYIVLTIYYGIAFFFVLSFGYRQSNAVVIAWFPSVAFSIFFDLLIFQPMIIFFRFALMNEFALRVGDSQVPSVRRLVWRPTSDRVASEDPSSNKQSQTTSVVDQNAYNVVIV